MHASTVVTRTAAGNAELASPTHGLSLAQRRFLTLLDTACSVEALAARQRSDAAKVERDLARLASLGLVACATPAANDDEATGDNDAAIRAANDERAADPAKAGLDAVRLGPRPASSRLPYVLVALGAAAMGLVGWRHLASSPAPLPPPDAGPPQVREAPAPAMPATPDAIATKILVGDPSGGKTREPAREAPKSKPASESAKNAGTGAPAPAATPAPAVTLQPLRPLESRLTVPEPFVAVPLALPVERRSPPATAPPVAAPPAPLSDAHDTSTPVHVANAAPPAAVAPARRLVPIAQEAPAFPREAIAAGLSNGTVKARVVVDAKGGVSSVEIVDTSHRAFDRAVRDALWHWRFEPGSAGRTTTVDVAFKRD